jgi:transposase-like protein
MRREGPAAPTDRGEGWLSAPGRAAELFVAGVRAAEVARQLGVSRQAAGRWHAAWKAGGTNALASRAAERDQAAIDHWVTADWPRIKNARRRGAVICFLTSRV